MNYTVHKILCIVDLNNSKLASKIYKKLEIIADFSFRDLNRYLKLLLGHF